MKKDNIFKGALMVGTAVIAGLVFDKFGKKRKTTEKPEETVTVDIDVTEEPEEE